MGIHSLTRSFAFLYLCDVNFLRFYGFVPSTVVVQCVYCSSCLLVINCQFQTHHWHCISTSESVWLVVRSLYYEVRFWDIGEVMLPERIASLLCQNQSCAGFNGAICTLSVDSVVNVFIRVCVHILHK